jgi:cytochrome c oxidase accessory protein FixG
MSKSSQGPSVVSSPSRSGAADFRNRIATADQEGRRQWIYPRRPKGRFYRARTWLTWILLAVMFGGPFVKINGNPLLMINIMERRFSVLGVIFWPQDNLIFALGFLLFLTGIAVFTAAFGRLWCGWTCPQTVIMEMVFRKIEYFIEGDASAQKALDLAPWTAGKVGRKAAKHGIFLALSFLIGNTLLAYIIGIDDLRAIVTDDPRRHITGLVFMMLFVLLFYGIFARFREQACTFICPYGRLQSTLLDENTIVVAYDNKRGEQRGALHRNEPQSQRSARGAGDCIDCFNCVSVCPTGIDIRHGTQMECVNCTACIDACDEVMDKVGRPRGLIRFASLNGIEKGERIRITPRIIGYCVVLLALGGALATLLLTRSEVDATLLRAQGALFQQTPEGKISNLYRLKLTNKTRTDKAVQLKLENIEGSLDVQDGQLSLPAEKQTEAYVLIKIAPDKLASGSTRIVVGVYSGSKQLESLKTAFIGPVK